MIDSSVTAEIVLGMIEIMFIPVALALAMAFIFKIFNSYD